MGNQERPDEASLFPCGHRPGPTIIHAIRDWVAREPDRLQVGFLGPSGVVSTYTRAQVWAQALAVARHLLARDVSPGDRVVLLLQPGEPFLFGFLGCLTMGAIPVSVYPPMSMSNLERHMARAERITADSRSSAVLSDPLLQPAAELLTGEGKQRLVVLPERLQADQGVQEVGHEPAPGQVAFIQYTSGSTGSPKGATILHRNLMAQLEALGAALPTMVDPTARVRQRVVSWLPPYHDMGLVGGILYAFFWGIETYLASPVMFIRQPWLWLRWISDLRATQTVAPNFAYHRVATRVPDRYLHGLDLSCLETAWNGAEPILPESVRAFSDRYSPHGFDPDAMFPVYGMAEATLCVTHTRHHRGVEVDRVLRAALQEQLIARPAAKTQDDVVEIVSVGSPALGMEVEVVDEDGAPVPERVVGEVVVRGTSLMPGYYPNEDLTDGWFHTKDLGYMADGELYVLGRRDDVVIVKGRNVFPSDVEAAAATVPGVRPGRVVAFGVQDGKGSQTLVVCAEPGDEARGERDLAREIRSAVEASVGVSVGRVSVVPKGWVVKTSSGKLRRGACRTKYLSAQDRQAR